LLGEWLEIVGGALEETGLEHVLGSGAEQSTGEMVPTSTGAIETSDGVTVLSVPGITRADDRWMHSGGFEGAGGRKGRHSEDFEPLWVEMTALYRAHPGARW
jgi:hypothetical protein